MEEAGRGGHGRNLTFKFIIDITSYHRQLPMITQALRMSHLKRLSPDSFVLIDKAGNQRWYGEYPSRWLSTADLLKEVRARLTA